MIGGMIRCKNCGRYLSPEVCISGVCSDCLSQGGVFR